MNSLIFGFEVADPVFFKDDILFTNIREGSVLHKERLRLNKHTQELFQAFNGSAPLGHLTADDCNDLFGKGWRDRVDVVSVEMSPTDLNAAVAAQKRDMVDRPSHYSRYGVESIDAMRGTMSPEEFNGFLKGNAFKYLTRAGAKDSLEQDLHKVCWYAMFLYLSNGGTVDALGKTFEYMRGRFSK